MPFDTCRLEYSIRWHPLSRWFLVQNVRQTLATVGLDVANFSGHSFRIGAATTASLVGISDANIQLLGQWRSTAFTWYIMSPTNRLLSISQTLTHITRHWSQFTNLATLAEVCSSRTFHINYSLLIVICFVFISTLIYLFVVLAVNFTGDLDMGHKTDFTTEDHLDMNSIAFCC